MTRAGREPAEDAMRRITAACEAAGLVVGEQMNRRVPGRRMRVLLVSASPAGWPHETSMIGIEGVMDLSGNVRQLKICCAATNQDPRSAIFSAPRITDADVALDELPHALRAIQREREQVLELLADGKKPPFPRLHWKWVSPGDGWPVPATAPPE
jgi:hypothetical protein